MKKFSSEYLSAPVIEVHFPVKNRFGVRQSAPRPGYRGAPVIEVFFLLKNALGGGGNKKCPGYGGAPFIEVTQLGGFTVTKCFQSTCVY